MPEAKTGLSSHEAEILLKEHGENSLPEKKQVSGFVIFLSQLKSPLVYVLLFASLVTLYLGHYTDFSVIAVAILVNSLLGFMQESRASNALSALKRLIEPKAIVIRDGKEIKIDAKFVVPGDICILNAGDKVPADGEVVFANRLFISEAILTGESIPVSKEKKDKVFLGTVITSGRGKMYVKQTGANTQVGRIATDIQQPSEDTPIRRQLKKFSSQLTILVITLTSFVFLTGLVFGSDPAEIFTTSVALAVSAIPEGLLVGLTVVLAIGMQRILKRQGLVRNLVSAETLGGVTTICVDKTGTLTEGKMEVSKAQGMELEMAKQAIIANDRDDPIVIALWDWANKKVKWKDLGHENIDEFITQYKQIDSIPFSAKDRFFASLNKFNSKTNYLYVNGAPEFLLEWSDMPPKKKSEILKSIDKYSSQGMRLLALARKNVSASTQKISPQEVKKDLGWVGLVAFDDPIRVGVGEALEKTKKAGIKLVVITGDYAQTAVSVLNNLGIRITQSHIMLGSELQGLSSQTIASKIDLSNDKAFLFARTTPEQKLSIVDSLKLSGHTVAMMGDGVNDALALKKADIGIVVGNATEVAKESADLVLLDSSFSTIVAAVEEGRGIFDNIRKIILYLMTGSFSEIIVVIGAILLGYPLPLAATQILWINLVSDSLPHLALTVDPKRKNIMLQPPRSPDESLVANWMKKMIVTVSVFVGLLCLIIFLWIYNKTSDLVLSQSLIFASLGTTSLVYVYSLRTLNLPFWTQNPFENRWLNAAFLGAIFLQVLPFLFSTTRNFLGIKSLTSEYWVLVFALSLTTFVIIEILKLTFKFNRLK